MGNTDNDNAVGFLRREPQNVGKIQIKRYQTHPAATSTNRTRDISAP